MREGQLVWVAAGPHGPYALHRVASADGDAVEVRSADAPKAPPRRVGRADVYGAHAGKHVPDHCQLTSLNAPTLLENTRLRFAADQIYTYVGDILVAVNPFKRIAGLYGADVMTQCRGRRLGAAACGGSDH